VTLFAFFAYFFFIIFTVHTGFFARLIGFFKISMTNANVGFVIYPGTKSGVTSRTVSTLLFTFFPYVFTAFTFTVRV